MMRDARFDIESSDIVALNEQPVLAEHCDLKTFPGRHQSSVMGYRAFMIGLSLTSLLLVCGCERPLYEATPNGTELTSWEPTIAVTGVGEPLIQELHSQSGAGYRVETRTGTHDDKKVPANIKVQLTTNPAGAEIHVQCAPLGNLDGDPPEVVTVSCVISERTGTKGLFRTKDIQRTIKLFVKGDGKMSLQEP